MPKGSDHQDTFILSDLSFSYGRYQALKKVSLRIEAGHVTGILGPNGSGKTTLLRILCGLLVGWEGAVSFLQRPLGSWDRTRFAKKVAYLPQQTTITFPYAAREVVLMGRLPHQDGSFFESSTDHERVEEALRRTGCLHLADRYFHDLSGGEQQLVCLASALAQDPDVLILDEPTVFLDLKHQLRIYDILCGLQKSQGLTLVIVTHDLNLAQAFCQKLVFLKEGCKTAEIEARSGQLLISPDLVKKVFEVDALAQATPEGQRILVRFGK